MIQDKNQKTNNHSLDFAAFHNSACAHKQVTYNKPTIYNIHTWVYTNFYDVI